MKVVDANVLLYSVTENAPHHQASRKWLDDALAGGDVVGFTWLVLLAFIRIATKPGLFPRPLSVTEANEQISCWLEAPGAHLIAPSATHHLTLARLLEQVGRGGDLVPDAHLAAIAYENRATVISYDSDFGHFPGVRWSSPR